MSRFILQVKAFLLRIAQTIGRHCDLYLSYPLPQPVAFTRTIPSSVGVVPGSFDLLFYTPQSYKPRLEEAESSQSLLKPQKYPLLVNFHGGGFTIGHASDDARWATAVVQKTSAVVVSVNYRLAPSYPFPAGIEDCVSAVLWLWNHAEEFNLDISHTAFSGFSAGGNLTYTVAIRLYEELARLKTEAKLVGIEIGNLVSLVSFYPSTDWTQSRAEREASNPDLIGAIPKVLYSLFDESYLYLQADMSSPLLSPGLAPDELIGAALPDSMVMITCSGDQLLAEGEKFRTRLRSLGKTVDGYTVQGVGHGWDKFPSYKKGNATRDEAYKTAVDSLDKFWA
jgi:acetyl esterase/lipase